VIASQLRHPILVGASLLANQGGTEKRVREQARSYGSRIEGSHTPAWNLRAGRSASQRRGALQAAFPREAWERSLYDIQDSLLANLECPAERRFREQARSYVGTACSQPSDITEPHVSTETPSPLRGEGWGEGALLDSARRQPSASKTVGGRA
jgi:hypothetical protein